MILASRDVGIRVLMELCHIILDGKGMPEDWATSVDVVLMATSVVIPILKGKGDIINCGMDRSVNY